MVKVLYTPPPVVPPHSCSMELCLFEYGNSNVVQDMIVECDCGTQWRMQISYPGNLAEQRVWVELGEDEKISGQAPSIPTVKRRLI